MRSPQRPETQTHRRRGHIQMEMETGVTPPQAKNTWGRQRLKGQEGSSPRALRKTHTGHHLDFEFLAFRYVRG